MAHRWHICTGRYWAHLCHICAGTCSFLPQLTHACHVCRVALCCVRHTGTAGPVARRTVRPHGRNEQGEGTRAQALVASLHEANGQRRKGASPSPRHARTHARVRTLLRTCTQHPPARARRLTPRHESLWRYVVCRCALTRAGEHVIRCAVRESPAELLAMESGQTPVGCTGWPRFAACSSRSCAGTLTCSKRYDSPLFDADPVALFLRPNVAQREANLSGGFGAFSAVHW